MRYGRLSRRIEQERFGGLLRAVEGASNVKFTPEDWATVAQGAGEIDHVRSSSLGRRRGG